jgi:trypsin
MPAIPMSLVFFTTGLIAACRAYETIPNGGSNPHPKIIGGTVVGTGVKYPWFASTSKSSNALCGAALIAPDILVSAAHCADAFTAGAVVGAYDRAISGWGGQEVAVLEQRVHPLYGTHSFQFLNDIQVMKITAVSMPPITVNRDEKVPVDGASLQAVGFGTTETGSLSIPLMEAEVLRVPDSRCYSYPSLVLCALHTEPLRTVCSGDSGGPLIDNASQSLVGIVSFGPGCDRIMPSGYTRVSAHFDWLQREVCALSANPPPQFQCHFNTVNTAPSVSPVTSLSSASPTVFPLVNPTLSPLLSPSISPTLTPTTTPSNVELGDTLEYRVTCGKRSEECDTLRKCCGMLKCMNEQCGKCWKRNRNCKTDSQCCSGECKVKGRSINGRNKIGRCKLTWILTY